MGVRPRTAAVAGTATVGGAPALAGALARSAAPAHLHRREIQDGLRPFRPLVTLVRWGTILVGVVLTASDPRRTVVEMTFGVVLVVHAALRSLLPLRWRTDRRGMGTVAAETALCYAAVVTTGHWGSPFVFTLVTSVVAAGFGSGFGLAVPLAAAISLAVMGPSFRNGDGVLRVTTEGCTELLLAALVAGYGRRLFGQAEQRTSNALTRLRGLTEANGLLQQLNAVAQTLPASLDLDETVSETMGQVRALLHPDIIAVFLWDPSTTRWSVGGAEGVRLPALMDERSLPVPVRVASVTALDDRRARLIHLPTGGPGLSPDSWNGIYAPLFARRSLVGVIAVEARVAGALSGRDLSLMTGVAEQAALAIDNARWFGRLRTVGAEEERNRIARDLHDRVAQSLAYLAFELDRIVGLSGARPVTTELEDLRRDVRRVISEVRDTLYDLRTDVSESQDLPATMASFLERVRDRSAIAVDFRHQAGRRLALPLERELWRIGQEAVTNVERHAQATTLTVRWSVDAHEACLMVRDDGRGFPVGAPGRLDSYGLLGMRERADAIGGTLEIDAAPGRGTSVRCRVEVT